MRDNNLMRLRCCQNIYTIKAEQQQLTDSPLSLAPSPPYRRTSATSPVPIPCRIINDILQLGIARTAAKMFVKVQIQ